MSAAAGWAGCSAPSIPAWHAGVALKILSPEHAADPETVARFQNEAQSAARLDHDNIARVYDVGKDRGLHYIVFEFIDGVNVRDLVESKGPLSLAEAVSYTLQVADALAHAAERNVVHRDIKPSNLLITPAGQAKLIDMGLARLREVGAAAADLTASGVTLGTFDYISPEQARDPRNTDVRSDIYSLGCTFFFMLAGQPPFLGGTMLQKLLQHQGDQPPDVRQFRPELPEDVNRILRKMLAKDPRHRYSFSVAVGQRSAFGRPCGGLASGAGRADVDRADRTAGSFLLPASAVGRFPAGPGGDRRGVGSIMALLAGTRQSDPRTRSDRNRRWDHRRAACARAVASCSHRCGKVGGGKARGSWDEAGRRCFSEFGSQRQRREEVRLESGPDRRRSPPARRALISGSRQSSRAAGSL